MKDTKRQNLPTGLWVVATPIGNLDDLTPRAQTALATADHILCEDTRRTLALLSAIGLSGSQSKLERCDAHATPAQLGKWIEKLHEGARIALVTDAGTPSVSDPGAALVKLAQDAGIRVTPVPGVSAVATFLSVAGFSETPFVFRGYFPRQKSHQQKELATASRFELARIFIWYESPQRIQETCLNLQEEFPGLRIVVGKELTKIYEKIFHGAIRDVTPLILQELESEGAVGEWCFGIQFPPSETPTEEFSSDLPWAKALLCLLESEISSKEAAKKVSQHFGISKNTAYDAALRLSGKKNGKGG